MSKAVGANAYLQQHLVLTLTGEPPMGEGSTSLDGKTVIHTGDSVSWTGVVLGPSLVPDFVWVLWTTGKGSTQHGLHRLTDLKEASSD